MVIKRVMQACTSVLALAAALYCGAAGAHGKVTMEEDTCMRRMGDNSMVHLSAYQPQYEPGDQYCTEIPKEGETFLVVDLVDQALRDIPVGMRIVRGTSEAEDETVTYVRPSYHPDGVIKGETTLDKGLYTVFITGDAVPPVHYQYPLRVRMINYTNIFRSAIGPLIVMMLLSLFAYKVVKSRRMRNWMDSRRR
ncbi:MAG: ORF4 protein [Nitrosospira sp.]